MLRRNTNRIVLLGGLHARRLSSKAWSGTIVDSFVSGPTKRTSKEESLSKLRGNVAQTIKEMKKDKQQLADKYLVNRTNERRLGKGRHGIVRPALNRYSGELVAVKSINKFQSNWYLDEEDLLREVRILDKLKGHPNVLELLEVFDTPINLHIVTTMCDGGDLFGYLHRRDFEPWAEQKVQRVGRSLLSALGFCHDHGIIHLDLKLENIMLKHDGEELSETDAVLIDFGHCLCVDDTFETDVNGYPAGKLERPVGSPSYAAPEVILNQEFTELSDAWSMGVILYTLMQGSLPFPHLQGRSVTTFSERDYRDDPFGDPLDWCIYSDESVQVLKGLLQLDPTKRMSVKDALSSKWLCDGRVRLSTDNSEDCKSNKLKWYESETFMTPIHRSSTSQVLLNLVNEEGRR